MAKKTGYEWWFSRIKHQLQLTDYLRIDHFRGFDKYWAVPYGEPTAINGKWMKAPGENFFTMLESTLGYHMPIIAEDLGEIDKSVVELTFEVMDRIVVSAAGNEKIAKILTDNKEKISATVLADDILLGEAKGYVKDWKINSESVTLGVEKQ